MQQTYFKKSALCAAVMCAMASTAQAQPLADALVSAYNQSGLLEQNRAVLRAADEDVAQAMQSLRPVINFAANSTYSSQYGTDGATISSSALSLSWSLFDNGRGRLNRESLNELVLSTRSRLVAVEQSVLLAAVNSYMNVMQQEQILRLRRNNLNLISEQVRAANDRFEVGETTRTDVALAEARFAAARASLAAAEGALIQAKSAYTQNIGRAPGDLTSPSVLPVIPELQADGMAIALKHHPEIVAAHHAIKSAQKNAEFREASTGPTLNLSSSYTFEEGGDETTSLGITFNQTLYEGGRARSMTRQGIANVENALAQLDLVRKSVTADVATAYSNLAVARASTTARTEQVGASRIAFEGVREEAALGARTTLDVLDAEQEYLDALVNQVNASADEVIALYSVLEAIGKLTAQELSLPVSTYDPTVYFEQVKDAPFSLSADQTTLDSLISEIAEDK